MTFMSDRSLRAAHCFVGLMYHDYGVNSVVISSFIELGVPCRAKLIKGYVARNRFHTMVEFTSALCEETDHTPELFGTGVIISWHTVP